jgi:Uma2 family endonuclease
MRRSYPTPCIGVGARVDDVVQPVRQRFAFADYVRLETDSTVRHEFLDGVVWAMAGGSADHAAIAVNVAAALQTQLAGKRCRVFSSDLRIRVKATGLSTYPDVSVVRDRLELDPDDATGHTVINPTVLVEVLSPSTEDYDRGEKLDHLKQIASVAAIVLVAHGARQIEVWREDGERWVSTSATAGTIDIPAIGCALDVEAVYRDPLA